VSLYKFWFMGAWRPVHHLIGGQNYVMHPEQANKVVIFVEPHGFIATTANPAEIFTSGEAAVDAGAAWDLI
jgi:hypothetical protein